MELTAKEWRISREEQDRARAREPSERRQAHTPKVSTRISSSSFKACAATTTSDRYDARAARETQAGVRQSPAGTLTAGNSTPLTDGASAVLLCSEQWAKERSLPMQRVYTLRARSRGRLRAREGLLMAPAYAVWAMLAEANLALQDFDFYEIHEAFAAQTLATLKAWESDEFCRTRLGRERALGPIDRSKLNVKGGSVAVGHPFAATGTRIRRDGHEAAAAARPRPRVAVGLHGRRHGRDRNPRSRLRPSPAGSCSVSCDARARRNTHVRLSDCQLEPTTSAVVGARVRWSSAVSR